MLRQSCHLDTNLTSIQCQNYLFEVLYDLETITLPTDNGLFMRSGEKSLYYCRHAQFDPIVAESYEKRL